MEEYSGLSDKVTSGSRVVVSSGPLPMGEDAVSLTVAVAAESSRSSTLICWMCSSRVFVVEVILYSDLCRSFLSGLCT